MSTRTILLGAVAGLLGCVFTGEETEGLPCNNHGECGLGLRCIERVCCRDEQSCAAMSGIDPSLGTATEETEAGTMTLFPDDDGQVRETCDDSDTMCVDDQTLRYCDDDGKLQTWGCQGVCGPGQESLGCHHSNTDERDVCFCGFAIEQCSTPGAAQCDGGVGLQVCEGDTWSHVDCDDLCVDNDWGGAAYCSDGTCYCDTPCQEGAFRCSNSTTNAVCSGGTWYSEGCTSICQANGYSESLGCFYYPDEDSYCYCI